MMAPAADPWHISSIQVKAFKSFGPSLSTFNVPHAHLSGIVGPNGCGKSNLLEAICFAAAGSTGVLRLTGRSLADVTSTDAGTQRPEVRLHISQGSTAHVLEACLTAEGNRNYKIDGRIKTGTQVKDFLKARGIVVDSTTVIQQAAVTGLSDSNNAQALAQLVAGASGLSSWNQETAAAWQEIVRTHKALEDIQANINKVQSSVAAEDAAFKAAAEAAQLEQQLEQQVQELLRGMQQRKDQLGQQLQDRQQEAQQLEEEQESCTAELQQLASQRKALATQQAEVLAQLEGSSASCDTSDGSNGSLMQQMAAAEAQAASMQAAMAARAEWASELVQKQQLQQQQDAQCELLQQRLTAKQQEAASLKANLSAVKTSTDAAAALQQQAQDASIQATAAAVAVQQQEDMLAEKQQDLQHADSRMQYLLQQWHTLTQATPGNISTSKHKPLASATDLLPTVPSASAEAEYAVSLAAAAAATASAAAEGHMQQVQGLQQQQIRLQMQAQAAERPLTLAHTASLLSQLGSSCSTVPLHACFRIKDTAAVGMDPQQLEQLLTPLSLIAGPGVLQILVAPTVSEANRLLAAAAAGAAAGRGGGRGGAGGGGNSMRLKIWPLDNLSVHDMQRQQRAAQQQLGQQAVMLPLDLLDFDAVHRPALLRAFGGFVIAADDATAAVLVERFGLSAVTLQGTVSRKGSMTGGWTGSSGSYAKTYWTNKQHHDYILHQLSAVQQQLSTAEVHSLTLQQQRTAAEEQLVSAQQRQQLLQEVQEAQADAAAAAAALAQEQQQLRELQEHSADLQQRLQQYKTALGQANDKPVSGPESSRGQQGKGGSSRGGKKGTAGGKSAAAQLLQQMHAEADMAAVAVTAAEQQLEEAQEKAEELSVSIEALEVRLAAAKDPQQQQEALQACLQHLQQLQQQQLTEAAAAEALQAQLQKLQQQQAQLEKQIKAAEQQHKSAQKQVAQAAATIKAAKAAVQKLQQDIKQAVREFSGTDAAQAYSSSGALQGVPATTAAPMVGAGEAPTEAQLQQLQRRARQLQAKLTKLDVPDLLPGQKEALSARLRQVAEFTALADALRAAAAGLEGQISRDAEQVYAANDVVYEDIAAGFSQLCSSLLPSLELQLVRVGSLAHEGLQFRFRRLQDTAAADPQDAAEPSAIAAADLKWHTSLGQLSGGQRTLVSLAMLLAVARTGSACGLLLLDEVDAALDEVNQARASALLRQLAHDKASACQILCVTHNVSFQESCDGFVRVTKSAAGHTVPAEQGAGPAAGAKAAGAANKAATTAAAGKGRAKGSRQGKEINASAKGAVRQLIGGQKASSHVRNGGRAKRVRFAEGTTEAD